MSISDEIRGYCKRNYVDISARQDRQNFEIPVRDVHAALQLDNAFPHVISALKAAAFSEENQVRLTGYDGPKESPTTVLHFEFTSKAANSSVRLPRVFIANFGYQNNIWESCLEGQNIATMNDTDTQPFWDAGDRDGFIDYCMAHKRATSGKPLSRSTASRWYNLMTIMSESEGDIWLHRAKDDLWWTTTLLEPHSIALEVDPDPNPGFPKFYVCRKPCLPWRNTDLQGRKLLWQSLHPKARYFLHTEATLQQLRGENPSYARTLIAGESLDWHDREEWQSLLKDASKGLVTQLTAKKLTFASMIYYAKQAASASDKMRQSKNKNKRVAFKNNDDFEAFLEGKYQEQSGLCALSNIPLQFQGPDSDKQFVCSLDRIDSDGHYEADNLQIVCHFINMWKSNRDNDQFLEHIDLIKMTP
jgi:hypothetical protein